MPLYPINPYMNLEIEPVEHMFTAMFAIVLVTAICGSGPAATGLAGAETRQSYQYVGVCTVLNTTIATIVVTTLLTFFPGLA